MGMITDITIDWKNRLVDFTLESSSLVDSSYANLTFDDVLSLADEIRQGKPISDKHTNLQAR